MYQFYTIIPSRKIPALHSETNVVKIEIKALPPAFIKNEFELGLQ